MGSVVVVLTDTIISEVDVKQTSDDVMVLDRRGGPRWWLRSDSGIELPEAFESKADCAPALEERFSDGIDSAIWF